MTKKEILVKHGIDLEGYTEYELSCVTAAMDEYATAQTAELQKEVERLKAIVDLDRMALEEIVNKEVDPIVAAGGALLLHNHKEPDESTKEWARKIIEKYKAQ